MQVNMYNLENTKDILAGAANSRQGVQASQKMGFFGVAVEKAGMKSMFQNDYMNYDKTGKESGQNQGQKTSSEGKQNLLDYINENIDKLKELVTEEDYSAMSVLGLAPDKEEPDTLLTVYERIQIELAAYCDEYNATGLNISSEKMKKVLGSEAMANAVKMAQEAGPLTDSSKAYLLKNDLEPTIENVYKAAHSTSQAGGRASSPLSDTEWNQLKEQISDILNKSGMEINEENLNNAKWLMEHDILVTADNLVKLGELNNVDIQNTDILTSNVAFALMLGMKGTEGYITQGWINTDEISETLDAISNVSDETIYDIVNDDATLNAANIKKYQEAERDEADNAGRQSERQKERNFENSSFIRARTVIIEARLVMTSSSLLNMQKLGINITYTEISVMLTQTKQEDSDYYSSFLGGNANSSVNITDSIGPLMDIMKSMSQVPSAVMGEIYSGKLDFTLESVYEESNHISASYSKAEITYEAVGTQVRTDLGDNISKAFESIDAILKDIGVDINESSRRAARILGYNQMEITKESLYKMESLMEELDYVRDNLTPKTAAYLVENHVNILNTDIRELNQNLVELNAMIGADESEDFAKYLWKLEKSGKISAENRNRYVDLYRTLNMVESMDSSSIGAVTLEGAEFTLNNLLSAVKSKNKSGMDIKVDDAFGINEAKDGNADEDTSAESIAEFVRRMAARVKSGLNAENVEKVYKAGSYGEISLGNLVDVVSDNESVRTNARLNAEYVKQVMDNYLKEAAQEGITEDTVLTLMEGGHSASMENIISAMELSMPGSDFKKYLLDKQNRKEIADAAENILENFEDEESAQKAMKELKTAASVNSQNGLSIDMSYERVKAMADINRNLRFMVKSAENESYNIPVDMDGEAVNIRVSFIHEEGEGRVNISMNTVSFGKIDCVIHSVNMVSGVKSEAIIYCENTQTAGIITGSRSIFVNEIKRMGFVSEFSMEVVRSSINMNNEVRKMNIRNSISKTENGQENRVESRYLYKISKSFIKSVKDCLQSIR